MVWERVKEIEEELAAIEKSKANLSFTLPFMRKWWRA